MDAVTGAQKVGFQAIASVLGEKKPGEGEVAGSDFKGSLMNFVNNVNKAQLNSQDAAMKLATGESKNIHEALISMEKASLSLQFTMQVRNRIVEAYQEIMRMQV